jgi:hypothetical protein
MKRLKIREIYTLDKGFDHVPDVKRVFDELKLEEGYKNFTARLRMKQ